jgi:adenylate cyclase
MMEKPPPSDRDEFWRYFLLHGDDRERRSRFIFRHIPSNPRCRLCAAPFGGLGRPIMRLMGKRPAEGNPNLCSTCFTFVSDNHGGAEIEMSLLFADIRGSTELAETMPAREYRELLDRFYNVAAEAIFAHDGFLDKFVGDEVMASFAPLLAGERHAQRAVEAAEALMRATGHGDAGGPWVTLGAGVTTGIAWMGAVGEGLHASITSVGDPVNVAARLAEVAAPGEVLVASAAAAAAGMDPALPHRQLELKGKHEITEVVSVQIGPGREAP